MNLGQALRQLRKQKGFTLAELAERTESHVGNLSRIERDIANPSLELLYRISNALGYSMADIFLATGDQKARRDNTQTTLNTVFVSLIQQDRELLLEIARLMQKGTRGTDTSVTPDLK